MLVVKIEMWPKGDASRAREIGRTYIANEGGSLTRGDYGVRVCRRGRFEQTSFESTKFARSARVLEYPRLRFNIWRLVLRALAAAFPEER